MIILYSFLVTCCYSLWLWDQSKRKHIDTSLFLRRATWVKLGAYILILLSGGLYFMSPRVEREGVSGVLLLAYIITYYLPFMVCQLAYFRIERKLRSLTASYLDLVKAWKGAVKPALIVVGSLIFLSIMLDSIPIKLGILDTPIKMSLSISLSLWLLFRWLARQAKLTEAQELKPVNQSIDIDGNHIEFFQYDDKFQYLMFSIDVSFSGALQKPSRFIISNKLLSVLTPEEINALAHYCFRNLRAYSLNRYILECGILIFAAMSLVEGASYFALPVIALEGMALVLFILGLTWRIRNLEHRFDRKAAQTTEDFSAYASALRKRKGLLLEATNTRNTLFFFRPAGGLSSLDERLKKINVK